MCAGIGIVVNIYVGSHALVVYIKVVYLEVKEEFRRIHYSIMRICVSVQSSLVQVMSLTFPLCCNVVLSCCNTPLSKTPVSEFSNRNGDRSKTCRNSLSVGVIEILPYQEVIVSKNLIAEVRRLNFAVCLADTAKKILSFYQRGTCSHHQAILTLA